MELFDSAGRRLAIEKELFRGGEGTIHPVAGQAALFAKLYHQSIDPLKQAKLAAMTLSASDALLRVAAWPSATLHAAPGGRMVGFLMPRFDGQRFELHHLYRPGTRKQTFRQADWSFLMHAARNVAAAVATVHAAGHVVGDVNQRNFIVGGDATVKVLDCDSFQIRGANRIFHCLVGVPEFTPPELQSRPLDSVERTANHDAFGLAVLVFQLLFMGRHPYAGRFLGSGEMPIERAIAEGRFAFGRNSRARLMETPPGTVPFESLPPRLGALFDAAFGGATVRPAAAQWTAALDAARAELRACSFEPMHKFYNALPSCSWCALERGSGVYFFIGVTASHAAAFDLASLWAEIVSLTSLPYEPPPRPAFQLAGTPVPPALGRHRRMTVLAKIAGIAALSGAAWLWTPTIGIMLAAIVVIAVLPLPGGGERKRRRAALREAERAWHEAYRAAEAAVSVEPLLRKRAELQRLKEAYDALPAEKQKELTALTQNARAIQLHHFLEQQLIRKQTIPGLGPKRKATLAAWGIETAADVTAGALAAIHGFGPSLQATLLAWRRTVESQFVFDAKRAIPQQELDAFAYRWHRRTADLEQQLRTGRDVTRGINMAIRQRRQSTAAELEPFARAWAQRRADLDVIERELS
jgi:DNA-binding helix-hairpin-helix protein with protein kinase domain